MKGSKELERKRATLLEEKKRIESRLEFLDQQEVKKRVPFQKKVFHHLSEIAYAESGKVTVYTSEETMELHFIGDLLHDLAECDYPSGVLAEAVHSDNGDEG